MVGDGPYPGERVAFVHGESYCHDLAETDHLDEDDGDDNRDMAQPDESDVEAKHEDREDDPYERILVRFALNIVHDKCGNLVRPLFDVLGEVHGCDVVIVHV